jgi:putative nucleotidyltransferase with HDIG domain
MAEKLESARQQVILKQLETIEAMINALEAKDPYTQGHCLRVGGYAREILDRCSGLSREQVFEAQAGAILHDIGKIGVPDHILLKRGALTDDESAAIERHVIIGENILAHLDSTREVARSVRHHHERWDGGGYPDGLRGEEIPFASRVISVADAIDALLTDRPYRRGKSIADVMTLLERERGRQFDPVVADHALSALRRRLETSPNAAGAALAPAALVAVE